MDAALRTALDELETERAANRELRGEFAAALQDFRKSMIQVDKNFKEQHAEISASRNLLNEVVTRTAREETRLNFQLDRVTVLEGDRIPRLARRVDQLEDGDRMDVLRRVESLEGRIQDLETEIAILKPKVCRCNRPGVAIAQEVEEQVVVEGSEEDWDTRRVLLQRVSHLNARLIEEF